jgi:hypothetical protein
VTVTLSSRERNENTPDDGVSEGRVTDRYDAVVTPSSRDRNATEKNVNENGPCNGPLRSVTVPTKPHQYVRTYVDTLVTGAATSATPTATATEPELALDYELDGTSASERRDRSRPSPDASPVVLTFPVVGKGSGEWQLRDALVATWQALYPNLDVLAEARQALAWIHADKARRKTGGGMERFLVAWLNRSVDSSRARGPTMVTGSLKTAGNKAALQEFLRRRGHVVD